jgi:Zn-dependent peptidase ImmA (M78 family)/DNA-binding XRE family transcriptional regulator
MLNPRRLENAMNARGLTQIAMASILDVSKGTISKWINGNHSPRNANERLGDISKILNVPIEWLVSEDLGETSVSFFRTNTSSTKMGREVAEARLKWAAEILFSFSEWVDYPEVSLPKIYSYKEWVRLDDEDIIQIAKDCRRLWSLDNKPISDLMFTCEMAGICIVQEELGYPKMDGLSFWYNNKPFIYLNTDKHSACRGRFNLAHELFHLIAHKYVPESDYKKPEIYKLIESQANLFASELIYPSSQFIDDLIYPSIDSLLILKRKWKLSLAAMLFKAQQLDLIDEARATNAWRTLARKKWRKIEPYDNEIPLETPVLFRQVIDGLIEQGDFSKSEILSTTKLSRNDVEDILSLPSRYLENDFGKIINFKDKGLKKA